MSGDRRARVTDQRGLLAPLRDLLCPRALPVTVDEVRAAARQRADELRRAGRGQEAAEVGRMARDWVRIERAREKWLAKYVAVKARQAAGT